MPPKRDFYVRVFLNKPDVTAETSIDDPHFAGSFAFFFDESAMKGGAMPAGSAALPLTGFLVDVKPTLQKLNQAGSLPSQLQVSLVPVPYERRELVRGTVKLGRIELAVAKF
jgi:hypothetical protein